MSLFAYAGKLRLAASKLQCYLANLVCQGGICCGGEWHGNEEDGDCCNGVWYPAANPCPEGQVYLRWGPNDACCGCLPDTIPDPRTGEGWHLAENYVSTESVKDDLCCPCIPESAHDAGLTPLIPAFISPYLPYDASGDFAGCYGSCCLPPESVGMTGTGLACRNVRQSHCGPAGGLWNPGCCEQTGCPVWCCYEDQAGDSHCEREYNWDCLLRPRSKVVEDCDTECVGICCVDGEQYETEVTQAACAGLGGVWHGVSGLPGPQFISCASACRPPLDADCCQTTTSTAAGLTFFQPKVKRNEPFTDTLRVTVSGHTDSSIWVHGIPIGASCDFDVTFLICHDSFNIEPIPCGSNFKKLDVKVCWSQEETSGETLNCHGCELGMIALGNCEYDCLTTLHYEENGHTSDVEIQVYGNATIESSGTGPLVLTHDIYAACGTLTLTGTNTGLNEIGGNILQTGNSAVIVEKRGDGAWVLSGVNTYTGQLRVVYGTLIIGADVDGNFPSGGGSPFGMTNTSAAYPVVGYTGPTSGTVSMLFADGVMIQRPFSVGDCAADVVAIGGHDGTSSVASTVTVTLKRDVTLQAAGGATVTFSCQFITSGVDPTITIGSSGNAGTVVIDCFLPGPVMGGGTLTEVIVSDGTARLTGSGDRIDPATPVTVRSATLDIDGISQRLGLLNFAESSGTVSGDALAIGNSGSGAINVDGEGHEISADVALAAGTTITIEADSDLTISGVVSGSNGITVAGSGMLTLSAANTYAGTTTINGGTVDVGDDSALGTGGVTVNSGAVLNLNGHTVPNTITNSGGTVNP